MSKRKKEPDMGGRKKVTIVGAGMTGGAMAQRLVEKGYCDVVLKDEPSIVETMHHGKALDTAQSGAWLGFSSQVIPTDTWDTTAGSEVVVLTAGAPRKPGQSREELLNNNAAITREQGVSIRDVHGYVLGGHTDTTMVPIVSTTMVGGMPLTSLLPKERIEALVERTMKGGAEVLGLLKTGSAYQAPGAATIEMVEAIVLDQGRLMPCSILLQGEYGIKGVCCGAMVKLGGSGVQQVYEVPVSGDELSKIRAACEATKELIGLLEPAKA